MVVSFLRQRYAEDVFQQVGSQSTRGRKIAGCILFFSLAHQVHLAFCEAHRKKFTPIQWCLIQCQHWPILNKTLPPKPLLNTFEMDLESCGWLETWDYHVSASNCLLLSQMLSGILHWTVGQEEKPLKLLTIFTFATGVSVVPPICFSPKLSVDFLHKGDDDFSLTFPNTC